MDPARVPGPAPEPQVREHVGEAGIGEHLGAAEGDDGLGGGLEDVGLGVIAVEVRDLGLGQGGAHRLGPLVGQFAVAREPGRQVTIHRTIPRTRAGRGCRRR